MAFLEGFLDKSINLLIEIGPKLVNLPKNERDLYRMKIDETYRMFDEIIMILMNRLGAMISLDETGMFGTDKEAIPTTNPTNMEEWVKGEFFRQLRQLNYLEEWVKREREIRLCLPLADALYEFNNILPKIKARLSLRDADEVGEMFSGATIGRGQFADYITESLKHLAKLEDQQPHSTERYNEIREILRKKYEELGQKRRELINAEIALLKAI